MTLATEAAEQPDFVLRLAEHGADAVRIKCAHDAATHWGKMIAHVPAAEAKPGRRIRVVMDIAGPKIRTRKVITPHHRDTLHIGDEILLVRDKHAADIDDVPFPTALLIARRLGPLEGRRPRLLRRRQAQRDRRARDRSRAGGAHE